mgnify:CR=1 FL=1
MFPIVTIGSEDFFDISGIVGPDFQPRSGTDGISIHHSVTSAADIDINLSGSTEDEEKSLIIQINAYHRDIQGWSCGFGYNAIVFPSGRVYTVGKCGGQRAHVAGKNHILAGIVMAGNYSGVRPTQALMEGVARWIYAMDAEYNNSNKLPVGGHRWWASASDATACPGDMGIAAIDDILLLVDGEMEENVSTQQEFDDLKKEVRSQWETLYGHGWDDIDPPGTEGRLVAEVRDAGGLVAMVKELERRLNLLG